MMHGHVCLSRYLQYFGIVDFDFRSSTLSLYAYDSQTEVHALARSLQHVVAFPTYHPRLAAML